MDWKRQVHSLFALSLLPFLPQANKDRNIYCIRWAFIDLSAGPFSWGPAVGGEGVRTELSLPNVEKTIGAVSGPTVILISALLFVCADVCTIPFFVRISPFFY